MNSRRELRQMKKVTFAIGLLLLVYVALAQADTLRLRSGQNVEGTFLGADTRQVKFLGSDGQPKTYPLSDVEIIVFSSAPSPVAASPAPPPPPPKPTSVQILAGTTLLVRMVDSLDTSKTKTGEIFTATLDTSLVSHSIIVARKGTTVHGKVIKSENARRLTGKSELQLALSDIVINGVAHPISTSGFQEKGKSEGAQTVKKVAVGAGLGAAIGAIAGNAGKGAAIGAVSGVGVSAIKKGEAIRVPSETLLEFTISEPTRLPVGK
jgi:hypothetical protein